MSIIARIRRKILSGQIVFSQHVLNDKLVQFDLEQEDLLEAMLAGKVEWRGTDAREELSITSYVRRRTDYLSMFDAASQAFNIYL